MWLPRAWSTVTGVACRSRGDSVVIGTSHDGCRIVDNTSTMARTAREAHMQESDAIASVPTDLFIGGRWRTAARTMPVEDPSTGQVLCEVADAGPEEAMAALDAAASAQASWAATPPRERSDVLARAYRLILDEADRLALIMTLEMGKPLAESRGEGTYAAERSEEHTSELQARGQLVCRLLRE